MPLVTFAWTDGRTKTIDAQANESLMVAAVINDIDGIEAECGGGLVCGTCHIHVNAAWMDKVGRPSSKEDDILDGLANTGPASRLACQIMVTDRLDGLVVAIPGGLKHLHLIRSIVFSMGSAAS